MPKGENNKFRKDKTLEEIYGMTKAKEIKEKIRENKRGHKFNGLPCPKCGKIHPDRTGANSVARREEVRKKMSENRKGISPFHPSQEWKEKIRMSLKNYYKTHKKFHSEESKRKLSETLKKLHKEGKWGSWIRGHKFNGLPCPVCGKIHPNKTGKNNPASREEVRKKIGEGNRKYSVVEKVCQNCGKIFVAKGKDALLRKYCSNECWFHSKEHAEHCKHIAKLGGKKGGEAIAKLLKGKTYEEFYGEEKAIKIKEKQRIWTILNNPMKYVDKTIFGKKVSEALKKSGKLKGENNPSFGIPRYPKSYYVSELGHIVRSSIEEKFCLFLKRNGIFYEYEPTYFKIRDNGTTHSYTPDLKIKDVYLELKQFIFESDWKKLILFKQQYPQIKYFILTDNVNIINKCFEIGINVIQVDKNFENLNNILSTLKSIVGENIEVS
jgi:uncharacterized protein with PIN domain